VELNATCASQMKTNRGGKKWLTLKAHFGAKNSAEVNYSNILFA
jgi:hypothetical protein